jgi:RHS repeat-associated protein
MVNLSTQAYDQSNRYRYNGKEEQVTGSIGLTDYGARFYDNTLPRWTTPDPLAEKYYSISPYAFCNNNPVNFVDPDGEDWYEDELGNAMWREGNEMTYIDETGKEWRNIGEEYLFFNGYNLYYYHQKECDLFKAVSGRPNEDGSFSYDKTRQALAGEGPIPEGFYYINPQEIQSFWYLSRIQKIAAFVNKGPFPKGPVAWGFSRVWISPENVKIFDEQSGEEVIRSGFSIYGGLTPGSAGCIDLSGNSFRFLENFGIPNQNQ